MTSVCPQIRILHFITSLETGGAEVVLSRLCLALEAQNASRRVVCLKSGGPLAEKLSTAGVDVLCLEIHRYPRPIRWLKLMLWVAKSDLLDAWLYHPAILSAMLGFLFHRPVLWNIRGAIQNYDSEKLSTKFVIAVCALLSRIPKKILYNSYRAKENHEKRGFQAKALIIPNGFKIPEPPRLSVAETRRQLGIDHKGPLAISVGRFHRDKDLPNLFRAWKMARTEIPDLRLVIVGRGFEPRPPELAPFEEDWRSIYFVGETQDVGPYYRAADVFVLSSQTESFPNVLAEAIAHGTPVVATDVGAVKDILPDSARLSPVGDSRALAENIIHTLRLAPAERLALIESNLNHLRQHFSESRMLSQYSEVYSQYGGRD